MARAYDADNPAIAIDTMLLKAVDEPSTISERTMDIMVVATIVWTGIDVRGLTCGARIVSSSLNHEAWNGVRPLHYLTLARVL